MGWPCLVAGCPPSCSLTYLLQQNRKLNPEKMRKKSCGSRWGQGDHFPVIITGKTDHDATPAAHPAAAYLVNPMQKAEEVFKLENRADIKTNRYELSIDIQGLEIRDFQIELIKSQYCQSVKKDQFCKNWLCSRQAMQNKYTFFVIPYPI